jgi:hypothetical protein
VLAEALGLEGPQSEKAGQRLVLLGRTREKRFTVDHVHLLAREQLEDPLQLVGIVAAVGI